MRLWFGSIVLPLQSQVSLRKSENKTDHRHGGITLFAISRFTFHVTFHVTAVRGTMPANGH